MNYCHLLLLLFPYVNPSATSISYDNFAVHHVTPITSAQLVALKLLENDNRFMFWKSAYHVNQSSQIMVAPDLSNLFSNFLRIHNLDSYLLITNVQTLINEQRYGLTNLGMPTWNDYQTLDQIYDWLRSLPTIYPKIVTLIKGGDSSQGTKILGVRVSFKPENKAVFLEGGIHSAEWISPATVTFILNQLLTNNDSNVREAVESRNWYVFPVVNPDGYEYTFTTDRMWSKNRKRRPFSLCFGVDLNRNWDYKWMHGGASRDPCNDKYAGGRAFSEIETRSLASSIRIIAHTLDTYLSFHSYGQLLLIPFGHSGLEVPKNNDRLHAVGKKAIHVLGQRYGTQYQVGNTPQIINLASGASLDWVLNTHRSLKLSYGFELRDTGRHGFLLPPEQIIPTGKETLDAIVSMIQQIDAE